MAEKIDIVLNYNKDGEMVELIIPIFFVANDIIRQYEEMDKKINVIQKAYLEVQEAQRVIEEAIKNKTIDKKIIDEKTKLVTKNTNLIQEVNQSSFFKKRFELVTMILKKNGIKEEDRPELYKYDFWDSCVEPSEILNFLTKCVYKDASKKKAQIEL